MGWALAACMVSLVLIMVSAAIGGDVRVSFEFALILVLVGIIGLVGSLYVLMSFPDDDIRTHNQWCKILAAGYEKGLEDGKYQEQVLVRAMVWNNQDCTRVGIGAWKDYEDPKFAGGIELDFAKDDLSRQGTELVLSSGEDWENFYNKSEGDYPDWSSTLNPMRDKDITVTGITIEHPSEVIRP